MADQPEKEKLFEQILTENGQGLKLFARSNADRDSCEDLEQEILLHIWSSLDGYECRSSLKTWFYGVAINTAKSFNRLRRNAERGKRQLNLAIISTGAPPNMHILEGFIRTLNEVDRTIMLMYIDRCSYQEISGAAALEEGAIRMRVFRLKKQLSEYAER